jgi:hypothetical protein
MLTVGSGVPEVGPRCYRFMPMGHLTSGVIYRLPHHNDKNYMSTGHLAKNMN